MLLDILVLSITQIIGWGTMFMAISVLGGPLGATLGMAPSFVYLGPSIMLVAMAVMSPLMAPLYRSHGARFVMSVGTLAAVPGFLLLAWCDGPVGYYAGWAILGTAGAGALTNSAHIYLAARAGARAKQAIGAQMLAMALAPTVSWPVTSLLSGWLGWRQTYVVFALTMLLIVLPLIRLALKPDAASLATDEKARANGSTDYGRYRTIIALMTLAVALNGFVTWGFQLVVIDIMRSYSVAESLAIGMASAIGVAQMSARLIDFLGGNRWDGFVTSLAAGMLMPVSLLVLAFGHGAEWSVFAFILLYGLSSGAMSVGRATLPLVFFEREVYATVLARIGLPLNLAFAAAPPVFSRVLNDYGNASALGLAVACSLGTLASLAMLGRFRKPSHPG
jgi:predicted MFS family arabinose efflux permease